MRSIREFLRGPKRFAAPVRDDPAGGTCFVRARPLSVVVEERYRVRQEISRNPDVSLEPGSTGSIEVTLPYDGHDHFTDMSLADVRHWEARRDAPVTGPVTGRPRPVQLDARVGHLVVTGHQDTDLAATGSGAGRVEVIPLLLPVRSAVLRTDGDLVGDRHEYRHRIAYRPAPGRPKLLPVQVSVDVTDPGSVSLSQVDPADLAGVHRAVDESQQYMTFQSYLEITVSVRVDLPGPTSWEAPVPVVRRVGLSLPGDLTLAPSTVEIVLGAGGADRPSPVVQHDPETASIVWFDIPTMRTTKRKSDGPVTFETAPMTVRIHEPGELFSERELVVSADVQTDDVLLSGADVRLFDARGRRVGLSSNPLTKRSLINSETTVVLGDAFAKRYFEPQQSFHFDEVIPSSLRVQDVEAALRDLRFTVKTHNPPQQAKAKSSTQVAHMRATRGDDSDSMQMQVFVIGRQHRTERQSQHPGGRRFTSKLDTGDLTLVVHGRVQRDSGPLVHEINELQTSLRDRFRRLKAQR